MQARTAATDRSSAANDGHEQAPEAAVEFANTDAQAATVVRRKPIPVGACGKGAKCTPPDCPKLHRCKTCSDWFPAKHFGRMPGSSLRRRLNCLGSNSNKPVSQSSANAASSSSSSSTAPLEPCGCWSLDCKKGHPCKRCGGDKLFPVSHFRASGNFIRGGHQRGGSCTGKRPTPTRTDGAALRAALGLPPLDDAALETARPARAQKPTLKLQLEAQLESDSQRHPRRNNAPATAARSDGESSSAASVKPAKGKRKSKEFDLEQQRSEDDNEDGRSSAAAASSSSSAAAKSGTSAAATASGSGEATPMELDNERSSKTEVVFAPTPPRVADDICLAQEVKAAAAPGSKRQAKRRKFAHKPAADSASEATASDAASFRMIDAVIEPNQLPSSAPALQPSGDAMEIDSAAFLAPVPAVVPVPAAAAASFLSAHSAAPSSEVQSAAAARAPAQLQSAAMAEAVETQRQGASRANSSDSRDDQQTRQQQQQQFVQFVPLSHPLPKLFDLALFRSQPAQPCVVSPLTLRS